jgi:hypothetical protein
MSKLLLYSHYSNIASRFSASVEGSEIISKYIHSPATFSGMCGCCSMNENNTHNFPLIPQNRRIKLKSV